MISAFGIEHGEISKGVPAGLRQAAKKGGYAAERLQANEFGRQAAKGKGMTGRARTANTKQAGQWARRSSRQSLAPKQSTGPLLWPPPVTASRIHPR